VVQRLMSVTWLLLVVALVLVWAVLAAAVALVAIELQADLLLLVVLHTQLLSVRVALILAGAMLVKEITLFFLPSHLLVAVKVVRAVLRDI